ncbi:MAG: hypothetical protein JWN08_1858 [Frankiales bacterium]|nr:hypothetical protein [Frankiales bacterium]
MDAVAVTRLLAIALVPSAVAAAVVWLPRAVRAWCTALAGPDVVVVGPPLERLAADLRRLLAEHAAVRHSPDVAVRAARLTVLEGALTDCALDAARALDLRAPDRAGRAPLTRAQLRLLLDRLAEAGLVLPQRDRFGR